MYLPVQVDHPTFIRLLEQYSGTLAGTSRIQQQSSLPLTSRYHSGLYDLVERSRFRAFFGESRVPACGARDSLNQRERTTRIQEMFIVFTMDHLKSTWAVYGYLLLFC